MKIAVIQVPYDSGHFNQRMGRGPLHLTEQGLVSWLQSDGHEVRLIEIRLPDTFAAEIGAAITIRSLVRDAVASCLHNGYFPITLAGNCNYSAFGAMAALPPRETGILWFDAHGDFNTPETSASGFFDGMCLSLLTGNGWPAVRHGISDYQDVPEGNVLLIGAHDLDAEERVILDKSNVTRIEAADLSEESRETIAASVLQPLGTSVSQIYLHIDLDVLDDSVFKANHFACVGGLQLEDLLETIAAAKATFNIAAVGLTAYDPSCDSHQRAEQVFRTILKTVAKA